MPVRSSSSRVLRWPDAREVERAATEWAKAAAGTASGIAAIGIFGSYARGEAGVGSDLDLIILVDDSPDPFERRPARFPVEHLPVPAEVLVYTLAEWQNLATMSPRFASTLAHETKWLIGQAPRDPNHH